MRPDLSGDNTTPSVVENATLATGDNTYETPRLQDLGTIADLTRGVNPSTNDGIASGSAI